MEEFLNRIHCGDCIEVMNRMPPQSVGVIVTSPPYNLRNSTGSGMRARAKPSGKWKAAALRNGYDTITDDMPYPEYVAWQRRCLDAMMRVLRPDGAIFYNHKWRVQRGLIQDRADIVAGFPVRQIIVWQRSGGFNFNPGYFVPTYEVIYLICKPDFRLTQEAIALGDVWRIPQGRKKGHPAAFPVELPKRCIGATTARVVLDPFFGSGSSGVAAEQLGDRDWIGIEISERYCSEATARIERERLLRAARPVGNPCGPANDYSFPDRDAEDHMRGIRREIVDAAREASVVARFRRGVEMLILAGCADRVPDLVDEFVLRYGVNREVLLADGNPRASGEGKAA